MSEGARTLMELTGRAAAPGRGRAARPWRPLAGSRGTTTGPGPPAADEPAPALLPGRGRAPGPPSRLRLRARGAGCLGLRRQSVRGVGLGAEINIQDASQPQRSSQQPSLGTRGPRPRNFGFEGFSLQQLEVNLRTLKIRNYYLKATGLLETTFVFCSFCQRLEISFRLQMSEMRFYLLRQRGRDTGRGRSRHHTESLRWDSIPHLQGLQDQALGCKRRQTAAPLRLLQYPPF
ncbi:uncharacterized protein LOC111093596 isoform X1 [Canis lupus familiaris]|uniref:uncharacterized protein LOC111093596 isoform X1 n=1 Tax=Canis lupus familiaris TaxID=9615 RepID=UPI0018F36F0D|nr:uncharacterized protein LOC111093596 isoform X1 [Canis lupus familiaris]XP_038318144.1 uncharacterized protein LOC111093596 isoform X1 [Canis lupus familiaris]